MSKKASSKNNTKNVVEEVEESVVEEVEESVVEEIIEEEVVVQEPEKEVKAEPKKEVVKKDEVKDVLESYGYSVLVEDHQTVGSGDGNMDVIPVVQALQSMGKNVITRNMGKAKIVIVEK